MKVVSGKGKIENSRADVLAILVMEDDIKSSRSYRLSAAGKLALKLGKGSLSRIIGTRLKGKKGQAVIIPMPEGSRFGFAVLLGLGPKSKLDGESFRRAAGAMIHVLSRYRVKRVHVELVSGESATLSFHEMARCFIEGAILRSYRYSEYKKPENEKKIDTLVIFSRGKNIDQAIERGRIGAEEANFARELVNKPGKDLPPLAFARTAEKSAKELKFSCRTYKQQDLKRMGCNAILAVGQGSSNPPCMVVVHYNGAKKKSKPYVFVGKGITFDSGGISLKPGKDMEKMKYDMAGAAAVLGAVRAAARLKLRANIYGIMALAENMPGGRAERPGDIIRSAAGITIEVANTDAEGRLVLADALHHAVGLKPAGIIDLATLTGAALTAVGSHAIALMGNNEEILSRVTAAGIEAGERTWLLPLWEDYEELVKSEVADVRNIGTAREAGTIVGGMFLKKFINDLPWAHLDIASTAWTERKRPYFGKGPTGKGTRLLVRLMEEMEK